MVRIEDAGFAKYTAANLVDEHGRSIRKSRHACSCSEQRDSILEPVQIGVGIFSGELGRLQLSANGSSCALNCCQKSKSTLSNPRTGGMARIFQSLKTAVDACLKMRRHEITGASTKLVDQKCPARTDRTCAVASAITGPKIIGQASRTASPTGHNPHVLEAELAR